MNLSGRWWLSSLDGGRSYNLPVSDGPKIIANLPEGIKTTGSSVAELTKPSILRGPDSSLNEVLTQYDPDNDPENRPRSVSADTLYNKTLAVPRFDESKKETQIIGQLALPSMTGRPRTQQFAGWGQLNKIRESKEWRLSKLRESVGMNPAMGRKMIREAEAKGKPLAEAFDGFSFGGQQDNAFSGAPPNDEFHPLLLGPYNRQLYLYDMLDMQSKAFELWNHHPIAKAIVNLMVHFVLGDGPKVKWRSQELQDKWDAWRLKNHWDEKTRLWFKDASIMGESFLHDPGSQFGKPSMTLLDPSTVWEIMTNPRNIDDVYYLHRQFPTQYQIPYGAAPKFLDATGGMQPPISEYVIEQFLPQEWLQVKLNATVGEKRGRSDLFAVMGWLKRFRDWFNAAVVRGQISNAFVVWWDINGSDADVQSMKNNPDFSRMPPPGTIWFSNKAAVPHLLTPEGTPAVSGGDRTGELLLSVIATALNLPPEYLGVSGAAARATALTRAEPAAKTFENRQQVVREAISWQARRFAAAMIASGEVSKTEMSKASQSKVVALMRSGKYTEAQAILAALVGGVGLVEPIDPNFDVIMPALEPQDRSLRIKDLTTVRVMKVISQETFSAQVAEVMDLKDYDYDAEQEKMADEEQRGIQLPTAPKAAPEPGSNGSGNGGATKGSPQEKANYRADTQERPRQ